MSHYPWAWTTPNAGDSNLADTGAYDERHAGLPRHGHAAPERRTARLGRGGRLEPGAGRRRGGRRATGARSPRRCCAPAESQFFCDEGPFGKGTGGQLRYAVTVPAGGEQTLWIGVAGSEQGEPRTRRAAQGARRSRGGAGGKQAVARAVGALLEAHAARRPAAGRRASSGASRTCSTSRSARTTCRSATSTRASSTRRRSGPSRSARWVGAGYPDYPWIFATDAEYTAFASVAAGQFEAIEDHARALRDVSVILNGDSGKVAHEIVADGSVYFGSLKHAGNTDETAKFPSLVALSGAGRATTRSATTSIPSRCATCATSPTQLDEDGDGWPEGLGNVERAGMGDEKLDNAVYTIRGLYDLADMARAKRDRRDVRVGAQPGPRPRAGFEAAWWNVPAEQYADSLIDPGDGSPSRSTGSAQTPMEAELTPRTSAPWPGLAIFAARHRRARRTRGPVLLGRAALQPRALPHRLRRRARGQGRAHDLRPEHRDPVRRRGQLRPAGRRQQKRYTDAEVEPMFAEPYSGGDEIHHTPDTPDEQPGASPEIFPSPDFDAAGPRDANVERCTRCRSMVMQAWNQYGTIWPVVHQQLGVRPDLGRGRLEVVPQVPPHEPSVAGANIRLGDGALQAVMAARQGNRYRTEIDTGNAPVTRLTIGHTLPRGARPVAVRLDGRRARRAGPHDQPRRRGHGKTRPGAPRPGGRRERADVAAAAAARGSSSSRSRALRVIAAARSNSARASSQPPQPARAGRRARWAAGGSARASPSRPARRRPAGRAPGRTPCRPRPRG